MSSKIREWANQITNRDVIERQNRLIRQYREKIDEQDEIIVVQSDAINEFRDSVGKLTDEIGKLKKKSLQPPEKIEGKKDE